MRFPALVLLGLASLLSNSRAIANGDTPGFEPHWENASPQLLERVITKRAIKDGVAAAVAAAIDESAFISTHAPLTIQRGKTNKLGRLMNPPLLLRSQSGALRSVNLAGNQLVFTTQPDPGNRYRLVAATDLDGNGAADIAYQNVTQGETGEVKWWNGFAPASEASIRSVKVAWDVQVEGDLDGDGLGDLVWRYMLPGSNDTGVSYVWFRNPNGTVQVRKRGGAPLNWKLLGAADLNGDGAADMAYVSPDRQIRILLAMPQRTCANFLAGSVPVGFTALRFADMSGGGKGDVLIRNASTGENRLLSLNATGVTLPPPASNPDDPNASCTATSQTISNIEKSLPAAPVSWQLYGSADLNNDGIVDLIWIQPNGTLTVWLMNPNQAPTTIATAGVAPTGFVPFPEPPVTLVPKSTTCVTKVRPGFTGNGNAIYGGGNDDGANWGGGSGGSYGGLGGGIWTSGGDGTASEETEEVGGGVSEGKVLGGLMTVTRFADGQVLGSAITDPVTGMVSIQSCASDMPLLLSVTGLTGARYYDEGTNTYASFGPGQILRALIDRLDENVGVSTLTEAAYQYAVNAFGQPALPGTTGPEQSKAIGNLNLTMSQVRAANQTVLSEMNRLLPLSSQLRSIKSLATPLDQSSADTVLPNNRYGIAAVVTGGIARNAANYLPTSTTPALENARQMVRDLGDGKFNGFAADGTSAGTGSRLFYDIAKLPVALDAANYAISKQFGRGSTYLLGLGLTDVTWAGTLDTSGGLSYGCYDQLDKTALLKDGSLNVLRYVPAAGQSCAAQFDDPTDNTTNGAQSTLLRGFATNVKKVDSKARHAFFQKGDGTVWSWGQNLCGNLGNGQSGGRAASPVQVSGLRDITSFAVGNWFALARDKDGFVYSWGSSLYGTLGLGNTTYDIANCDIYNGNTSIDRGASRPANHTPRRIPSLTGIVAVAADQAAAYALAANGQVYQWGLVGSPADIDAFVSTPVLVAGIDSVVMITTANRMVFALKRDGTVWGWGANTQNTFGNGSATPIWTPTQVPGLSDIVQIAGDGVAGTVALRRDGLVFVWDFFFYRNPTLFPTATTCQQSGNSASPLSCTVGPLPRIRHLHATGARVILYGENGGIFSRYSGLTRFDIVATTPLL